MGTSPSKENQKRPDPTTLKRDDDIATEIFDGDERLCSNQDDDESFVFIDKEWSCSISSAEDAVLAIDEKTDETAARPQNGDDIQISEGTEPTETNCGDLIARNSPQTNVNHGQDVNKVEVICTKESDPTDVVPSPCSVAKEFSIHLKEDLEVQNSVYCLNNYTSSGKEEWISGRLNNNLPESEIKLFEVYKIFSNYGSVSALVTTKDYIYMKFSSWAGIANVFEDIKNLRQLHQFTSLQRVEEDEVKSHTDRREVYLDLPSVVVSYLKEHSELTRAIVIIRMTTMDNMCFNTSRIHQTLNHLKNNISRGFQNCTLFPFGCHILGSWDRYEPLEIFVDTGNMYAGCHKQSEAEQTVISKEVRKLMSHGVTWSTLEESPIGAFCLNTVGLKCILYFNNGFGDRATRLLKVFMEYDERFRILYFVLDAWSRQCSLQGISHGFNSYIMAVLLVFYLQMLPVPVLPPIQRIRTGRSVFIKGWDCTFTEDAHMIPRNECTMRIHSLLRGFFVFYGSYDWDQVVCPALGLSIDRKIFSHPPTQFPIDTSVANYFRALLEKVPDTPQLEISTSMCVQDFFNLSENIAKYVSSTTLLRFQSLCRQSHKMIYAAESRLSCGGHNSTYSSHLPTVPLHELNVRPERCASQFNRRAKVGHFPASSQSWVPTSRPVLQKENNYEEYRTNERPFPESHTRGNGSRRSRRGNGSRRTALLLKNRGEGNF